ncbi:MAG: PAS domain S-box protein [Ignavibacteria bacterium]|nr:PAS domain S-box protein [Ignavibacteria bacterium]
MKRFFSVVGLVFLLIFINQVKSEKVYKAVFDYGYYPYEFAEHDTCKGFLVDILKEISKEVGIKIEVKSMQWGEALKQFDEGKFDIICMYYSDERAQKYNLSNSVINVTANVFYRKGAKPIKSPNELNGKEILVEEGPLIKELVKKVAPDAKIIIVDNPSQAIELMVREKYEYAVIPKFIAYYYCYKNNTDILQPTDIIIYSSKNVLAVHKDNVELIQKINEGLDLIHHNGRYLQIYNKWFGEIETLYEKESIIAKYWLTFLISLSVLIALFFLWNYSLKKQVKSKTQELEKQFLERIQLEQQHKMAQFVIDHSIDMIFGIDKDSRFIYVNDAVTHNLGYTRAELLKMTVKDIDSSFKIDKWQETYWELIKKGEFNHYRTLQRRKDGSYLIVEGNIFYFEFEKKEYVFAIMRDVTEKEKMMEQIVRSEEILRSIFENTQLPMYIFDPQNLKINDINKAAEDFYGYSKNEFLGMRIVDLAKNNEEKLEKCILGLKENNSVTVELLQHTKSGELREVSVSASVIKLKDGDFVFCVVVDNTEKNEYFRKIKESEEKFFNIFNTSPDGVSITRVSDGMFLEINDSALKMLGVENRSEVLLNPDYTTTKVWNNLSHRHELVEKLTKEGEAYLENVEMKKKNGAIFYSSISARLIELNGEKCILAISRDITEKKNQEVLRSALFQISDAAISTPDFISLCKKIHSIISDLMPSQNFYIALHNKEEDLFEYPYFVDEYDPPPPPRKRGKGLTELVIDTGKAWLVDPDEFYSLVEKGVVESIGAPSIDWLGVPLKVSDEVIGAIVVQSYTEGIRYSNEHKNILSFVSNQIAMAIAQKRYQEELIKANELLEERVEQRTIQLRQANEELIAQVEERMRIENEIRESEQRFRLMADSAPVLIWMNDYTGRITYTNKTWIEFTGKEIISGLTDNWQEFIHEEDMPLFIEKYNESFNKKDKFEVTVRLINKTEGYRYVLLTATPRIINNDIFHGYIGSGVDVTELHRAIEKEQELNSLKTRFISTVSHEYRTPLTTIMTASYLVDTFIKTGNLTDASKFISRIQASVKSMTDLLDQVLTISKSDTGDQKAKPILTNIYDFCHSFVDEYRIIDKNNHNIYFETTDDTRQQSYIDPTLLQQILSNLISNAIKYSPIDSDIVLTHRKEGSNLIFEVKDNGIGIPKEQIRYIFEPFYRATNTGVVQGSGLGLSIVKRCIDMYRGKIEVESQLNEGTIVKVILPEVQPEEE